MPTHPECLYYLYKGYTHEVYSHVCIYMCGERNQNPPYVYIQLYTYFMEKGSYKYVP